MIELRYRLTQPPDSPWPFAPWFERVPGGRVHAVRVAYEGNTGRARVLAVCPEGADVDAFTEDVLGFPLPNASVWVLDRREGRRLVLRGVWGEPIYPGVPSPMWIAREVFGGAARCAFTVTRDVVLHRVLVPGDGVHEDFWFQLRDGMNRYAGYANVGISCELEGLRSIALPNPPDRRVGTAARTAYELGVFDDTPAAGLEDVATLLDVPQAFVEEAARRIDH